MQHRVRINQSVPGDNTIIVGIDAKSIAKNGRWPWSRSDQAKIIENVSADGAKVILIDFLYADSDATNPEDDVQLVNAIESAGSVILPMITEGGKERLPIPEIANAALNLGHIFLPIDRDGIVRRVFLQAGFATPHWSILSLAAMESLGIVPKELPGKKINHSDATTNWVGDFEVLIPFRGPKGTFNTFSAVDVLENNFARGTFNDSTVFFGITATGLADTVPTPIHAVDQAIPGVEVHANIYTALVNGDMIGQTGVWLTYALVAASLAMLLVVYSHQRPTWALLTTVVLAALPVIVSYLMYRLANLWFAPLVASLPILLAFPIWACHRLESHRSIFIPR